MLTKFSSFLVRLFDVSRWQDDLSTVYKPTFEKLRAAGFLGVVIRVGSGTVLDVLFTWFWKVAKGLLERKPYWYLDYYSHKGTGLSDEAWGIKQAGVCYEALKTDFGEAPLAVDCEKSPNSFEITFLNRGSYNRILKSFIAEWKRLTGFDCDIYCSPGFIWVFDSPIKAMGLWVALYNRSLTVDQAISYVRSKGWTGQILIWQYSSDGDVDDDGKPDGKKLGMETDALDLDVWLGSVEEWSRYCGGVPISIPTPPSPPAPAVPPFTTTKTVFVGTVKSPSGLNIRSAPEESIIGWLPDKSSVEVLEIISLGSDLWARIGHGQYCAIKHNGVTYLI